MIILDTNVVSELMRSRANPHVLSWFEGVDGPELATTSITVAEIEFGLARLPSGSRGDALRKAAVDLWQTFAASILSFDAVAAVQYGRIMAERERVGRSSSVLDVQIAAITTVHGATLATRNVKDFRGTGIRLVDPWKPSA